MIRHFQVKIMRTRSLVLMLLLLLVVAITVKFDPVSAVKQPEGGYQYVGSMDLSRNVSKDITNTRNNRIIRASSKMGEGRPEDIRKEIDEITNVFLKARSGG
jgi:hypothetical protein